MGKENHTKSLQTFFEEHEPYVVPVKPGGKNYYLKATLIFIILLAVLSIVALSANEKQGRVLPTRAIAASAPVTKTPTPQIQATFTPIPTRVLPTQEAVPTPPQESRLSPVFTPQVLAWEDLIVKWADVYSIDPNLAAIIMQIESCGNANAVSSAGARGLFQVMPYHFAAGENPFDPDTNAMRGLNYYAEALAKSGGNEDLAFAAYNGGHGQLNRSYAYWPYETKRYYYWASGIRQDIQNGLSVSTRLQEWLGAGGSGLCH